MAAITHSNILTLQDNVMKLGKGVQVAVVKPGATDDATAGVYKVKDPRKGTGTSAAAAQGNARDGWKSYSHADLTTAYGL